MNVIANKNQAEKKNEHRVVTPYIAADNRGRLAVIFVKLLLGKLKLALRVVHIVVRLTRSGKGIIPR